ALASCSHGAPVRAIRRTGFRAPRRRGSPLFPYTTLFRSLNVMYLIARDYRDTRPMSFDRLAEQLRIPAIALTPVVNSLESAGLILATEREGLVPGRDMGRIRHSEILDVVRRHGETGSYRG